MTTLALKWTRSTSSSFIAQDPERCGRATVACIHEHPVHPELRTVWGWSMTAPSYHFDTSGLRPLAGECDTPREAAAAAEACYRRFLAAIPPETLAGAVEIAEHWRQGRENWARIHGVAA